ncbi:MAG: hypothetical protein WA854_12495 [Candidatus Binataceae bacterium]
MHRAKTRIIRLIGGGTAIVAIVTIAGCALAAWMSLPGRADSAAIEYGIPSRVLALSPTPKGGPPLTTKKVAEGVGVAAKAGVTGDQLFNLWNALEPSPGQIDVSNPAGGISYLGGTLGWTLELTIGILNTSVNVVPSDLQGVAFDDPRMIARFHALLDQIFPIVNSHVEYLSIGNEVDVYLAAHPDDWPQYQAFYADAVAYVHAHAPGVKVGVATTWSGTSGVSKAEVAELNSPSDVWIITYYPLGNDFIVDPPGAPLADFPAMVNLAGGKPVVLQEVGYPTSHKLNSSDAMQEEFVRNVFSAWQAQGERIPFLSYVMEHDLNRKYCDEQSAYYGVPDPDGHFSDYFCTLGLLTVDGGKKPGWKIFLDQAAALTGAPAAAGD